MQSNPKYRTKLIYRNGDISYVLYPRYDKKTKEVTSIIPTAKVDLAFGFVKFESAELCGTFAREKGFIKEFVIEIVN